MAFRNGNAGKQLEGWTRDFAKLRRIDRRFTSQRVSSVTSVLFGVGFTAAQFEEATERGTAGMEIDRLWVRNLEAGDLPLCIHAITGDAR